MHFTECLRNIYLEGMKMQSGKIISAYVFMDDQRQKVLQSADNPDKFVKYGKWEMRIRDKILIEMGFIVHAKIKWYGGGEARPYLWKPYAVKDEASEMIRGYKLVDGSEYCQSWSDPRKGVVENKQISTKSDPLLVIESAGYESIQTSSITTPSTDDAIADMGKSIGDTAMDFGSSVGSAIADTTSTIGGLFDIQPSQTEEPQSKLPKKKKVEKKRGRSR